MEIDRKLLDRISEVYSEEFGFERVLLKYKAAEISKYCTGDTMLDLGSGLGFLCQAFAPRFRSVLGIDGSERKVKMAVATNQYRHVDYQCTLFENFRPNHGYDFIVATNVLEHMPDSQAFLGNLCQWLTPRGRAVLTVPNALGLHKRIGKHMGVIDDYYQLTGDDHAKGHFRTYDSSRLREELVSAGLAVDGIGGILLKPLSHKQMESWDPQVVDALYEIGKDLPEYCSSLIAVVSKKQ